MNERIRNICVTSAIGVLLASIAVAQDSCYVCPDTCTTSGNGCASWGSVTLCDVGAADAQEGQEGWTELNPITRQGKCYTYTGGTWLRTACSEEPLGPYDNLGSCRLDPGQCCFNAGGTVSESTTGFEVQDCQGDACTGSGGSGNEE